VGTEVVAAVADRARADLFDAQRAIAAVLDTAAEHVDDEVFVAGVAERAHLSPARAREFATAVFDTLRETLIRPG
jgi:hypothetical protein